MRSELSNNGGAGQAPSLTPELVTKLSDKKVGERERAEQAIDRLGPDAVDALMAVLRKEADKRKRKRWIIVLVLAYVVLMLGFMIATRNSAMIGSISSMGSVIVAVTAISQAQKNAAKKLTEYDDIRTVGPLAEALHYQDKGLRNAAVERLGVLLPRLKASDHDLMTEEQKLALYKAIKLPLAKGAGPADWAFLLAALGALEQIGDERALPFVDAIVERTPSGTKEPEVVEAARACRPALLERIEQQRVAMRLLRPSEAPADAGETLLRPTYGPGQSDPDLLLRPSDEPEAATES